MMGWGRWFGQHIKEFARVVKAGVRSNHDKGSTVLNSATRMLPAFTSNPIRTRGTIQTNRHHGNVQARSIERCRNMLFVQRCLFPDSLPASCCQLNAVSCLPAKLLYNQCDNCIFCNYHSHHSHAERASDKQYYSSSGSGSGSRSRSGGYASSHGL